MTIKTSKTNLVVNSVTSLNQSLFLWMNAPQHPDAAVLTIATFFAQFAIWSIPLIITVGWLFNGEHTRKRLVLASASGMAGLLINQIIGLVWQHPRPFMIGLGNTFMSHANETSFPSDHLTLLLAVAFSLLTNRQSRWLGIALALLGLPVAWSRIYLGVHFPVDMAGSFAVAALCAWLTWFAAPWYLQRVYDIAHRTYRISLHKLIELGWIRR